MLIRKLLQTKQRKYVISCRQNKGIVQIDIMNSRICIYGRENYNETNRYFFMHEESTYSLKRAASQKPPTLLLSTGSHVNKPQRRRESEDEKDRPRYSLLARVRDLHDQDGGDDGGGMGARGVGMEGRNGGNGRNGGSWRGVGRGVAGGTANIESLCQRRLQMLSYFATLMSLWQGER